MTNQSDTSPPFNRVFLRMEEFFTEPGTKRRWIVLQYANGGTLESML